MTYEGQSLLGVDNTFLAVRGDGEGIEFFSLFGMEMLAT